MKTVNVWIVICVAIVSLMAIGFYAINFWGSPISDDTSAWADFSTYVSGTVGVAAVVGTLMAFVITLRQQQRLIDSQEEMLIEQRVQISIMKKQGEELKKKNKIDIAYSSTAALFPDFCKNFELSIERGVSVFSKERELSVAFDELGYSKSFVRSTMLNSPNKLLSVAHMVRVGELESYVGRVFENINRLYCFMVRQVEAAPELKFYFENYLFSGRGCDNIYYFHLYQSYLVGRGEKELLEKGVKYLNLWHHYPDDQTAMFHWAEVGRVIQEKLATND